MGQAKRARSGIANNIGINWKAIMQWLSFAYITYIVVVFCLVCPKGYIEYDILKSRMFWIPSLVFALCEVILWAVSLDRPDHFKVGYVCHIGGLGCQYSHKLGSHNGCFW